MYGSCLPIKSPSFRKVASIILTWSLHFLLRSFCLGTRGGSGSFHLYSVEKVTVPAFLPFLVSRSTVSLTGWGLICFEYGIWGVSPRNSRIPPVSSSYERRVKFWFYDFFMSSSSNFSFQTACFPASSFTVVLNCLPWCLNLTKGSYLPNMSASFK